MPKTESAPRVKQPTPLEAVDVPVYSAQGAESGTRSFTPGEVFNFPNYKLLKEAVRRQQGRLRRGTASTRTRSEIRGSNRKPWRQKGTGRARAGTRKSPLWRGGGTIFGPKPRRYDYGLPRKQRRLAVRHALLSKLVDGETRIVDDFTLDRPQASKVAQLLKSVGITGSCLIGVSSDHEAAQVRHLVLSCRNLPRVKVLSVRDFDTLSLLQHQELLLTGPAFDEIQIFHIDDEKTAEIAFEAGEIDFTRVSLGSLERLKASPPANSTIAEFPSLYYVWIGMNLDNPKLQNKKLRQAIQHAIDVPSIMEAAYFGVAKPSKAARIS